MPLQVLPPGVTSLSQRLAPAFNAPLINAGPQSSAGAFINAALAQDPRSLITTEADANSLRFWMRTVTGNSWRDDLTLDDLMRVNPSLLYKATCLFLQGRYWGSLPDDWTGDSASRSGGTSDSGQVITHEDGSRWLNSREVIDWPRPDSPLEQRIFTWDLKYVAAGVPSWLADATNGTASFPIIRPTMVLQKFDDRRGPAGAWRVLNLGGVDRKFSLDLPGGAWRMTGWDFGEWYATNADFATVLKVIGIAVAAIAAVVTGGAALASGAGLFTALGAAQAAFTTVQQIDGAFNTFITACVSQDIGGALNGLAGIVKIGFGVDMKDLATYQPGIDMVGGTLSKAIGPFLDPIIKLGGETGGDFLAVLMQAGREVGAFADKSGKFFAQLSIDTARSVTGAFPDVLLKALPTMSVTQIGQIAEKLSSDYARRAMDAARSAEDQIPVYLRDWKEKARGVARSFGFDQAIAQAASVPWYGRSAYDVGAVIGGLENNASRTSVPDLNQLTPKQKRALFVGDIAQVCSGDPQCLINAAEFLRQGDMFWEEIQQLADKYNLRPLTETNALVSSSFVPLRATR